MFKKILFLIFFSSLLLAKPNGCDLSQVGDVKLQIGSNIYEKTNYKAIAPSGKNFRSILVGSTINTKNISLKIVAIKANKRVKGKPRTGIITITLNNEKIPMTYNYNKGHFKAKGILKNKTPFSFALEIKALLCHVETK